MALIKSVHNTESDWQ